MKMYSAYIIWLSIFVIAVSSAKKDKYTDENRPYEFGFNIEGQQHRHEAKDEAGLITGEFGFITADGVYHVTVYATDENGAFKIVSMKSIKVSPPLDGSPDPAGTKYNQPSVPKQSLKPAPGINTTPKPPATPQQYIVHAVKMPDTNPSPPPPVGVFTTAKPLPVPSCSSCGIPSTTKRPPGVEPNKFVFQTAGFQKPPNPSPNKAINQIPQQNPAVQKQTIQNNPVHNPSSPPNKLPIQTQQNNPGTFHSQNNPIKNPVINPPPPNKLPNLNPGIVHNQIAHQNPGVIPISISKPNNPLLPSPNPGINKQPNPLLPSPNPVFNKQPNPLLPSPNPGFNKQPNPLLPSPNPGFNKQPNPLPPSPNPGFNKQPNPAINTVQVPQQELQGPRAPETHTNIVQNNFVNTNNRNPPNYKPGPTSLTPYKPAQISTPTAPPALPASKGPTPQINLTNNLGLPKPPSKSPQPFFPGLIHPPSTHTNQQQHPPIDGKLPPGVTVDDMLHLLYRFNYTVGFHGHYESGFKNGAKIGGYFINGRDGISRIVEYVADENGYRPKITYVNLGLDSPDTPKAETEKNYGLRGQVFEWFSL